jgi:hypothetical protein
MTYIYVGYDFNYLSLITDAYSKKIVGYCLHQYLSTEGCLHALTMALASRSKKESKLIHRTCDDACIGSVLTAECSTAALNM